MSAKEVMGSWSPLYSFMCMFGFPLTLRSFPLLLVHFAFVCERVRYSSLPSVRGLFHCDCHPQDQAHTTGIMSNYSALLQRTTQGLQRRRTPGGQGWALARCLPASHKPPANTTHTLPHDIHFPTRVPSVSGSPWLRWPLQRMAGMLWWGPDQSLLIHKIWCLFQREILLCVAETGDRSSRNPSQQTWWIYTPETLTVYGRRLRVISRSLHVPGDHPDCIWLCFCLLGVYVYVCSMVTSCG